MISLVVISYFGHIITDPLLVSKIKCFIIISYQYFVSGLPPELNAGWQTKKLVLVEEKCDTYRTRYTYRTKNVSL